MKRQMAFEPNPVLVKELRGRMRGPRAFIFLTAILVLLGLVSYGLLQIVAPRLGSGNLSNVTTGVIIGQGLFNGLAFLTLAIVCVIAPSLTAGAISSEHQHKTFDLLVSTPLRPIEILSGKLFAALSYVALIMLAAVPMMSLAYVFGGVTVGDLVKTFVVMCSFALAYAVIGLFFSALFVRTGFAIGASYVLLAFFVFGTTFIYVVVGATRGEQPPSWILATNPVSALASVLTWDPANPNNFSGGSFQSVLWGLAGGRFDNTAESQPVLWYYTAGVYSWLTLVLFGLTTQLVKPVQRFRFRRRTWFLIALFIAVSILAAVSVYGPYKFTVVRAIVRWTTTEPYDLIENGNFGDGDTGWQIVSTGGAQNVGNTPAASSFAVTDDHGKRAVHLAGTKETLQTQSLTQVLGKTLPEYGELKLAVVLRLSEHAQSVCGTKGDQCPLQIRLDYEGADGKRHSWQQGWYASGKTNNKTAPPRCRTCENRLIHFRAPLDEWSTYITADLMDPASKLVSPRQIHAITLTSAGTRFDTEVASVSLMLHEGRPLIENRKSSNQYGWSWRSVVPWWITSVFDGGGIRRIVIPNGGVDLNSIPIIGPAPVIRVPIKMPPPPPAPTAAPPTACPNQNGGTCP